MSDHITIIADIENENFNILNEYFDSLNNSNYVDKGIRNFLIYADENYLMNNKEYVENIEKLYILKNNNNIRNTFNTSLEYLKSIFSIRRIWLMSYSPKSNISFHTDSGLKRHVISFNEDEMFFNYECSGGDLHNRNLSYTENLEKMIDDPLRFNEFFLKHDPNNKIINLKKNKIYSFGDCGHSFFNASNTKYRFNLVFEIF